MNDAHRTMGRHLVDHLTLFSRNMESVVAESSITTQSWFSITTRSTLNTSCDIQRKRTCCQSVEFLSRGESDWHVNRACPFSDTSCGVTGKSALILCLCGELIEEATRARTHIHTHTHIGRTRKWRVGIHVIHIHLGVSEHCMLAF